MDGEDLAETINGAGGNDLLFGNGGNDVILGGEGWDKLIGGDGNDILEGGAAQDELYGGAGDDTYLFGPGDGLDLIYGETADGINTLIFKSGILPSDLVIFAHSTVDLTLSIVGTNDRISVRCFFCTADDQYFALQRVRFADGTTWDAAFLATKVITSTTGADNIVGNQSKEDLSGGLGNDIIFGRGGNDVINGGPGNDQLIGGAGNDTFLFATGDGQDSILPDPSYTPKNPDEEDEIKFGAGINPSDISVTRSTWYVLELAITGSTDKITFTVFDPDNNVIPGGIRKVSFANGTTWDFATLLAKMLEATPLDQNIIGTNNNDVINAGPGNDRISAIFGDDQLNGGEGDDTILGGDGNDTLEGGTGTDILEGDAGNNIYLFGKGDGNDTIKYDEFSKGGNYVSQLQFKAGISPSEVLVTHPKDYSENLVLSLTNGTDSVTIKRFFYSYNADNIYNPVQIVKFADGTEWNISTLINKTLIGTSADDLLTGYKTDDTINGGLGNDRIIGLEGNDTLNGESGTDYIDGGPGNDVIDGGVGKDTLIGGEGNDTFLLRTGSGVDKITGINTAFGIDRIVFSNITPTQVRSVLKGQNDLTINYGTTDQIVVEAFFVLDSAIDEIQFSDGTIWDVTTIKQKATAQ